MPNMLKRTVCMIAIIAAVVGAAEAESHQSAKTEQDGRTLVLPFIAVGGAPESWHFLTILSIENAQGSATTGTVEFFSGDGRPLHVQLNDNTALAARTEWRVSGKDSTLLVISHPGGSFEDGWLRVHLAAKTPLKVIMLVQCYNGEQLFAEAGSVGQPGMPVGGPYYRVSHGSNPLEWRTPQGAPRVKEGTLFTPGMGSGARKVRELGVAAQSVVQSGCSASRRASGPPAASSAKRPGVQEIGYASWYGKGFDGKKSASGAPYNKLALTAAHRTLPFGTRVKVTNLQNGCSVNVRITDRGPYVPGRIVDLSLIAARRLDLVKDGVSPVLLEAMPS